MPRPSWLMAGARGVRWRWCCGEWVGAGLLEAGCAGGGMACDALRDAFADCGWDGMAGERSCRGEEGSEFTSGAMSSALSLFVGRPWLPFALRRPASAGGVRKVRRGVSGWHDGGPVSMKKGRRAAITRSEMPMMGIVSHAGWRRGDAGQEGSRRSSRDGVLPHVPRASVHFGEVTFRAVPCLSVCISASSRHANGMMQRRSARRTERKKYNVDAFADIPELRDASDNSDDPGEGEDDDIIDGMDTDPDLAGDAADDDDDDGLDGESDAEAESAVADDLEQPKPRKRRRKTVNRLPPQPTKAYIDYKAVAGLLGGHDPDQRQQSTARWARDPTLPSRESGFHPASGDKNAVATAEAAWNWFLEQGGKDAFANGQITEAVQEAELEALKASFRPCHALMGPYTDQRRYRVDPQHSLPLSEIWNGSPPRHGFMLCVGSEVRCLQWAPTLQGRGQYLAVLTRRDGELPKSMLQIWHVNPTAAGDAATLDHGLHVDGTVRAMHWCPVPCPDPDTMGLMALVCADGFLRIIAVPYRSSSTATEHTALKQAHIAYKPPTCDCTAATWVSATEVTVGCSNSRLHLLALVPSSNSSETAYTTSYLTKASGAAIVTLSSCAPTHPHVLLLSSADGSMRCLDATRPGIPPLAFSGWSNTALRPMPVWHPHSRTTLSVNDRCQIQSHELRGDRDAVVTVMQPGSIPMALATSPVHPVVLAGTAHGSVTATNPLQTPSGPQQSRWQQTLFTHEWRETPGGESDGISRVLEGYRSERFGTKKEGKGSLAVGERKAAVTAVAWNPNVEFGGWAAVAWADGLVRVEDVAV